MLRVGTRRSQNMPVRPAIDGLTCTKHCFGVAFFFAKITVRILHEILQDKMRACSICFVCFVCCLLFVVCCFVFVVCWLFCLLRCLDFATKMKTATHATLAEYNFEAPRRKKKKKSAHCDSRRGRLNCRNCVLVLQLCDACCTNHRKSKVGAKD